MKRTRDASGEMWQMESLETRTMLAGDAGLDSWANTTWLAEWHPISLTSDTNGKVYALAEKVADGVTQNKIFAAEQGSWTEVLAYVPGSGNGLNRICARGTDIWVAGYEGMGSVAGSWLLAKVNRTTGGLDFAPPLPLGPVGSNSPTDMACDGDTIYVSANYEPLAKGKNGRYVSQGYQWAVMKATFSGAEPVLSLLKPEATPVPGVAKAIATTSAGDVYCVGDYQEPKGFYHWATYRISGGGANWTKIDQDFKLDPIGRTSSSRASDIAVDEGTVLLGPSDDTVYTVGWGVDTSGNQRWVTRKGTGTSTRFETVDTPLAPTGGTQSIGYNVGVSPVDGMVYVAGMARDQSGNFHWMVRSSSTGNLDDWSDSDDRVGTYSYFLKGLVIDPVGTVYVAGYNGLEGVIRKLEFPTAPESTDTGALAAQTTPADGTSVVSSLLVNDLAILA